MLGPTQVASYAKKFGFAQEFRPFLSMALGAQEVTLMEITSAFSAFPNHGIRMEPYLAQAITDREGALLEERRPQPKDAIRADTAYVMTNLLQGVVQRGTAAAAQSLNWPLAGKTGTVDDNTDAWFIGFDPEHHRRRLDGPRREEADRRQRDRHHRGLADVDRLHEGLPRSLRAIARIRRRSIRPATSCS